MSFDYGIKLPDGQHEHHPVKADGVLYMAPIRDKYIHTKCNSLTKMGRNLAETYAKNPTYYSSTFCVGCSDYFPVSEFVWDKDTSIRLGELGGTPGEDQT